MAFRIYIVIRCYVNYSVYTDIYTKKLCQNYGFNTDVAFTIKSRLLNKPLSTILMMFIGFVLFYSYLLMIFEAPYYNSFPEEDPNHATFDSITVPMWLCIITLTTVGYGDVFAKTNNGRLISVAIAISGAFLMALVVTIVTN